MTRATFWDRFNQTVPAKQVATRTVKGMLDTSAFAVVTANGMDISEATKFGVKAVLLALGWKEQAAEGTEVPKTDWDHFVYSALLEARRVASPDVVISNDHIISEFNYRNYYLEGTIPLESANIEWEKAKANLLASKTPEEFVQNYIIYRAAHRVVDEITRRRAPDLVIAKKDPIYDLWVATVDARKAIDDALMAAFEEEFRKYHRSRMGFLQGMTYDFKKWATANPWFGQLILAITAVIIFGPAALKAKAWLAAQGISAGGLLALFEKGEEVAPPPPPPPPPEEAKIPWALLVAGVGLLLLATGGE